MSSGNMPRTQHPELFQWSDALDPADYLHARYRVGSIHDGEATALALAMEQSAATTHIRGHVTPAMLQASTIRVVSFREAAMLEERAKEVPKAELEEYLSSGYGIFAGRKVEWATIRFTPLAARWVSAQRWHSKQRSRTEADGSYVLEVPYANDQELLMEVLKFGPEAEVLAPSALRERAASQLREAAAKYR